MRVDHGVNVWPGAEDGAMDEAFEVKGALFLADGLAIEGELEDIFTSDKFGRQGAGQEKMAGILGMPHTHVAIGIDHILMREDAIGNDEIVEQVVELANGSSPAGYYAGFGAGVQPREEVGIEGCFLNLPAGCGPEAPCPTDRLLARKQAPRRNLFRACSGPKIGIGRAFDRRRPCNSTIV